MIKAEGRYGPMVQKIKIKNNIKHNIEELENKIKIVNEKIKPFQKELDLLEKEQNRLKIQEAKQECIWHVVDQIIESLIQNEDVLETTFREATVSYIINQLEDKQLLKKEAFMPYTEIKFKLKPSRKFAQEPYQKFKKHPAWKVLDQTIEDLVENQDMVETTVRKCIVGYIIKRLMEQDLLK